MDEPLAGYSCAEFDNVLVGLIADILGSDAYLPQDYPSAVLVGGQSGAGKTTLHAMARRRFRKNVIVINGDEYRAYHPRYRELDEKFGPDAVAYTARWAGEMTEALIDEFSRLSYNLIIEGTLRTHEVPVRTAELLRSRGYAVSLALMAVKPEISLISCQIRYESMRIAGTVPRATDPAHHDKIVQEIVENLGVLENSGLFDEVRLFSRAKECLYPLQGETRAASAALKEVLFGPWSAEELRHYEYLKARLKALRAQ